MSLRAARLAAEKAAAEKLAASGASAPSARAAAPPEYVYRQQAPSVVENVLTTILHPGVNQETFNVLNGTLVILFIVISLMLFLFNGIASKYRLHLWIFLAVCFSLLLSVNWFFTRYQSYGGDSDDEEEDEEVEGEGVTEARPAKKVAAAPRRSTRSAAKQEPHEE